MPSKPTIPRVCEHCGAGFLAFPSEIARRGVRFCSQACHYASRRLVPRRSLASRFWEKVRRGETCWLWIAGRTPKGYGYLDKAFAHRLSWQLTNGPIPDGLFVLHRCDNPACVRPDHLWLGTQADNLRDMAEKDRSSYGERSGNAKLTLNQAIEIRHLVEHTNLRQSDIASRFGVSRWTIRDLTGGKSWRRLGPPIVRRCP